MSEENHIKSQLGQYDPNIAHTTIQPESICDKLKDILAEVMSKEEGLQVSLFELMQRRKINTHLAECKNSKCNELRVERINTGLF